MESRLDSAGNVYIAGYTTSVNFPTQNPLQATSGGGPYDAVVAKFNFSLPTPELAIGGFPSPDTAGAACAFTLTAESTSGGVDASYTGTVHFTSTDPRAVLPADYTFTAADNGVHTFSATLKTPGIQSITATDKANGLVASDTGITVTPAPASIFILSAYPSPTNVGLPGSFTLSARDAFGNLATGYIGTVHFTSSDGFASLPTNYTYTSADAGVHTFSACAEYLRHPVADRHRYGDRHHHRRRPVSRSIPPDSARPSSVSPASPRPLLRAWPARSLSRYEMPTATWHRATAAR